VLLLDTGAQFLQNHRSDRNFALVAEMENSQPPRFDRVLIAVICAVTAIALTIAEVTNLFTAAAVASAVMLLTGCISSTVAREAIKWDVIVTIACAFGLSNALDKTGGPSGVGPALSHAVLLSRAVLFSHTVLFSLTVLFSHTVLFSLTVLFPHTVLFSHAVLRCDHA
jgi:di/tricarboxylate transporter